MARYLGPGRIEKGPEACHIRLEDDLSDILHDRAVALFADSHLTIETGLPHCQVDILGKHDGQVEICLREGNTSNALDVQDAGDPATIVKGNAHLRLDALDGAEKIGIAADVFDQRRRTGERRPAHDALREWNPGEHPIVPDLML